MLKSLLCIFLVLFISPLCGSENLLLEPSYPQKKAQYKLSNFWKRPEDIKASQYNEFLNEVIYALGRPDIWNSPQNLLHVLSQFRKFPEETDECRDFIIFVIRHRIVSLLSKDTAI